MNRTAITIGFFTLAALGVIGAVLILTVRPESFEALTSLLVTILGIATTGAVTFSALDKQDKKLDTIRTQTNGANTALRDENTSLTAQLLAVVGNTPSPKPPSHRSPAPLEE